MKASQTLALALALLAAPGALIAQAPEEPVTARNQGAHLETLFTENADQCLNNKRYTDAQRAEGCEVALAELGARRATRSKMSVTEAANYDFFEALLNIAQSDAFARVDGTMSARTCDRAERSWSLTYPLRDVPKNAVEPEFYDLVQNPPSDIDRVLGECRSKYGKPADGAPLPAEFKKKK